MSRLSEDVADLEQQLTESEEHCKELTYAKDKLADALEDLKEEIRELRQRIAYYESIHTELTTAWEVKQRMEEA